MVSGSTSLPLWSVEELRVGTDVGGVLDAVSSSAPALSLSHYPSLSLGSRWPHVQPAQTCSPSSYSLFLSDVRCLSAVIFESNKQGSSSLSYVALWEVHADDLLDGIHSLAGILVFQPEKVLADGGGKFEGTGDAVLFKHSRCYFGQPLHIG